MSKFWVIKWLWNVYKHVFFLTWFFPILCCWVCLWYVLVLFFYFSCSCFLFLLLLLVAWVAVLLLFYGRFVPSFRRCCGSVSPMPFNRTQHCKDFQKAFRRLWKRIQLLNVGCKICLPSSTIDDFGCNQKKINVNSPAIFIFGEKTGLPPTSPRKSIPTFIPMSCTILKLWGEL